ncbi:MAG: tetratricopeptide repeat protein, partial [Planctomycetota bacterium]
ANPRAAARPAADGARARAWKFIDHGDRHFRAGRYREALSRYRRAVDSSGDVADARFREGFAYLSLGSVERAALSIRRGLDRDPAWPDSAFVLDDLYPDEAARDAAYKVLADRLKDRPNDADARFLAGVLLHFDGRPNEAERQFRRVIKLAGDDAASRLFLSPEIAGGAGR